MYSVVCRKSFELLKEVNKTVEEHRRGTSVPIVLIGNKSDLAHMRQVTHEEGIISSRSLTSIFHFLCLLE